MHDCFCFTPGCDQPSAKEEDYALKMMLPTADRGKYTLQQLATGVAHSSSMP